MSFEEWVQHGRTAPFVIPVASVIAILVIGIGLSKLLLWIG